jgi:aminomethyltransferase
MTRQSILNVRHRELGSKLDGDTWNDMPLPWFYSSDPNDEVVAVRSRAGLYDISALNILNVTGPDAQAVIDSICAIDVTKLKPGTCRLAAEVDERGAICDDLMVICDAPERYRISHGGGVTQQLLKQAAEGRNVEWHQDFDVHMLSLQGPTSATILQPHIALDLNKLPYFAHVETKLFGRRIVISRGGYSGEQGFEVSCRADDAIALWDSILEAGKPHGIVPASWTSLELARIEAALLFYPFDMPEGDTTPWELNLDWMIDADKKADYHGKAALLAARGKERFKQAGVLVKHDAAVTAGSRIFIGDEDVGVVTSATFSQYLMQSLAMVHLKPNHIALGTKVEIRDPAGTFCGAVTKTPFYDPQRLRTRVAA